MKSVNKNELLYIVSYNFIMMITFVFVMITFVFVMHTSSDKLIFLISGLGAIYCYNEFSKRWLEICKTIDKLREV